MCIYAHLYNDLFRVLGLSPPPSSSSSSSVFVKRKEKKRKDVNGDQLNIYLFCELLSIYIYSNSN